VEAAGFGGGMMGLSGVGFDVGVRDVSCGGGGQSVAERLWAALLAAVRRGLGSVP